MWQVDRCCIGASKRCAECQLCERSSLRYRTAHLEAAPAGTVGVRGGATRSQSVKAALEAAFDGDAPASPTGEHAGVGIGEAVIVHDAARVMTESDLFDAALKELERSGADAVIVAAPVSDTIKEAVAPAPSLPGSGITVNRTLDRSRLWAVQTPQVFRRDALERAMAATEDLLAMATDDAWLVEQQGGTVAVLPASAENLKITTPHDLRIAELILSERLSTGVKR